MKRRGRKSKHLARAASQMGSVEAVRAAVEAKNAENKSLREIAMEMDIEHGVGVSMWVIRYWISRWGAGHEMNIGAQG